MPTTPQSATANRERTVAFDERLAIVQAHLGDVVSTITRESIEGFQARAEA